MTGNTPPAEQTVGSARKKVLIVDDQVKNVKILTLLCQNMGHDTLGAANGREAVELASNYLPDIILMDVMMPEMDGFAATNLIKSTEKTKHIPIIMITALDSREDRLVGIASGADDFLTKPIDREELTLRLRNNLRNKEYHDFLLNHKEILEKEVAERIRQQREGYIDTIFRLTLAAEYKDEETGSHLKRISHYTKQLAQCLDLGTEFCDTIYYASPMHDIGKVSIPDAILQKQELLTSEEWGVMKMHTTAGAAILQGSDSPFLQMAVDIAHYHHEKWDGSGYPCGLRGEEIPLTARIMAIADQYDALRSRRRYKPAYDHAHACHIITMGDSRTTPLHFDPTVLAAFQRCASIFSDIFAEYHSGE